MHKLIPRVRTSCAQTVRRLCMQGVGNMRAVVRQCTTSRLYTTCTAPAHRTVHNFYPVITSVKLRLVPTVHTPYKEQKYLNLNIINTNHSGELS